MAPRSRASSTWSICTDFADRSVRALSGGQQQRVAVARALAVRPKLLLLDEPFSALDRKLRETMQIELRRLLRELAITAIFVTHDQDEALIMSDRVAVMNRGRIEQFDTPGRSIARPARRSRWSSSASRRGSPARSSAYDDGGVVAVATAFGPLRAGALPAGSPVLLGVRPERIGFGREPARMSSSRAERHCFPGRQSSRISPAPSDPLLVETADCRRAPRPAPVCRSPLEATALCPGKRMKPRRPAGADRPAGGAGARLSGCLLRPPLLSLLGRSVSSAQRLHARALHRLLPDPFNWRVIGNTLRIAPGHPVLVADRLSRGARARPGRGFAQCSCDGDHPAAFGRRGREGVRLADRASPRRRGRQALIGLGYGTSRSASSSPSRAW